MGDVIYAPLIDDMVWSYSRIKCFSDCPYRFYMKYIRRLHGKDMFFANYGSFLHELIASFYSGGISKENLTEQYLLGFKRRVVGQAPSQKVFTSYFLDGLNYLNTISKIPIDIMGIEKKISFCVGGKPFIGYIDLLGKSGSSLCIIDHKSRKLKPRSNRGEPTKTDQELDDYLVQLYLYSVAVEAEFGKKPEFLCFNCFREGTYIKEQFYEQKFELAKKWALDSIETIRNEADFRPSVEWFKCTYLCEMQDHCEYYEMMSRR